MRVNKTLLYMYAAVLTATVSCGNMPAAKSGESAPDPNTPTAKAIFAGGCFWCMEKPFEVLDGVHSVVSGYTGGQKLNPTYKEVGAGTTGHTEAVEITYDPARVSYDRLLEVFWMQIDPTDLGGQFVDRGSQYRPEIFYLDAEQKQKAEKSKAALTASKRFDKPIVVPITEASKFYPAEEYHQDFYKKSPMHYKGYRRGSGRDRFLDKYWSAERKQHSSKFESWTKPDENELQQKLDELQFYVTQQDGTERPFANKYWDNKKEGIYVDIVSGEPLFSSIDKFKSGTGWPSFTRPLVEQHVVEKIDRSLGMSRVEVRSKFADSHLGHLFDDGPQPTGMRYCINSASLRFIPVENLKDEGYTEFLTLFESRK